jgi:hypothetical protein
MYASYDSLGGNQGIVVSFSQPLQLVSNHLSSFWKESGQYQEPRARKPPHEAVTIKTTSPGPSHAIMTTTQQQISMSMPLMLIWTWTLILTLPCAYFLRLKG